MRWTLRGVNIAAVGLFVGSVHLSVVVHGEEGRIAVADVISMSQGNLGQGDGGASRIDAAGGDVGVRKSMEEIVGRPVFLNDDNHVLDFRERYGWRRWIRDRWIRDRWIRDRRVGTATTRNQNRQCADTTKKRDRQSAARLSPDDRKPPGQVPLLKMLLIRRLMPACFIALHVVMAPVFVFIAN
jgi:hypothetical protein